MYGLLPLVFGIGEIIHFVRRQDVLGSALAHWAVLSLAAQTVAAEKMPWLVVNITTPFILVVAKVLGDLADRVDRPGTLRRVGELMVIALQGLAPFIVAAAVYLFFQYFDLARPFRIAHWLLLAAILAVAFIAAYVYCATPAVGLGLVVLLLAVGVWAAVRAAYSYDDFNAEVWSTLNVRRTSKKPIARWRKKSIPSPLTKNQSSSTWTCRILSNGTFAITPATSTCRSVALKPPQRGTPTASPSPWKVAARKMAAKSLS